MGNEKMLQTMTVTTIIVQTPKPVGKRRHAMNKAEAKSLWSALSACTCKPGTRTPFDCVCVLDRVIYATDGCVLHRIEGLYEPGSVFVALYGKYCVYAPRVKFLDEILTYTVGNKDFTSACDYFDPAKVTKALRVHKSAGAKHIQFIPATGRAKTPLIIRSEIPNNHGHIIITSAIQGLR